MNINQMRLGLVYIFSESKSLSNKTKLNLINFIEQADEQQLKSLALKGYIVEKETMSDFFRDMIDENFSKEVDLQEKIKCASDLAKQKVKK